MCHAATNPMFRSCMALSSSSPLIENCQGRGRESVMDSDSISTIEAPTCVRTILTTFYHIMNHNMQLLGMWSSFSLYSQMSMGVDPEMAGYLQRQHKALCIVSMLQ